MIYPQGIGDSIDSVDALLRTIVDVIILMVNRDLLRFLCINIGSSFPLTSNLLSHSLDHLFSEAIGRLV